MPAAIDLWPPEVFVPAAATPIALLRQQGEALGSHTHNFVHGEVETTSDEEGRLFTHTLYLVAPFLRYRKPLIRVTAGLQPYPATAVETDLTKLGDRYWSATVINQDELLDRIREFFNEPRVKEVVRAVVTMSRDVVPPDSGS